MCKHFLNVTFEIARCSEIQSLMKDYNQGFITIKLNLSSSKLFDVFIYSEW